MLTIETPNAPHPSGHYAQAVVHDGLVYVSGQLPLDPQRREKPVGSIEDQTRQALSNVAAILTAAGSGLDRVLLMTIYISDVGLWSRVDATYAEVMGDHRPARAVVPTRELHYGFQIEIQTVAAVG